jgi:hypothetical protein
MSNVFTLDAMRSEIEHEFAPCQIELAEGKAVTLRNLLRVPKNNRELIYALLDELSEIQKSEDDKGLVSTEKSAQVALKILPLVADSEKLGRQLVESIQDDLALTLRVFSRWIENTQSGEAEGSPNS